MQAWIRGRAAWLLGATAALVAMFTIAWFAGMEQYPGYDGSMIVSLGWRLALGQTAPQDFFSPLPPLFALGSGAAFTWFGPRWASLVVVGGFAYASLALAMFMAGRTLADSRTAALVAGTSFVLTGAVFGFWYHNPIAGLLAGLACLLFVRAERSPLALAAFAVTLGGLLASKPNLAGPATAVLGVGMLLPRRWGGFALRHTMAVGAIALGTFVVICFLSGQGPLDYLQAVASIAGKRSGTVTFLATPSSRDVAMQLARNTSFFVLAAYIGALVLRSQASAAWLDAWLESGRQGQPEVGRRCVAALAALCGFAGGALMNGDNYHASMPALLAVLLLLPVPADEATKPELQLARRGCVALVLVIVASAAYSGFARDRVFSVGPGAFWEPRDRLSRIDGGFFDGLRSGPILQGFEREAATALNALGSRNVFFGPRVEFGYAEFGLVPPRNVPIWLDPAAAWPPGQEGRTALALKEQGVDTLVFLAVGGRPDFTHVPRTTRELISREFVDVSATWGLRDCTIFLRRDRVRELLPAFSVPTGERR